jgi:hypothetical protein
MLTHWTGSYPYIQMHCQDGSLGKTRAHTVGTSGPFKVGLKILMPGTGPGAVEKKASL